MPIEPLIQLREEKKILIRKMSFRFYSLNANLIQYHKSYHLNIVYSLINNSPSHKHTHTVINARKKEKTVIITYYSRAYMINCSIQINEDAVLN